jgi:hypothetical protein
MVLSSDQPQAEAFILDVSTPARPLPPTDLPSGGFAVCANCGGDYRCAGCPRPRTPASWESTIDTAPQRVRRSLGGLIHDFTRRRSVNR